MSIKKIELLAPAGNLRNGISAINAGADAVYIGGMAFGAREKAGNSIEDIAQLVDYAHRFGAKVYMTVNTIIYDDELEQAQELIREAWQVGVDALIVQDMAILEMELPPIPLHASTQTFNMTVDRVKFLSESGFDRVILERGISLPEIIDIHQACDIEFEAFVHGAICVGYSGQCYLSEALCGRSGNRGACAQPCRSKWNLEDENGRVIKRNETLLSVGDLNLSENLADLIDAGVTSLKIEGRLKDEAYVVNNVAHYNKKLEELGVERTSHGHSVPSFEPNPSKSFSRSFSSYLLMNRQPEESLLTHFQGEYMGRVIKLGTDFFELDRLIPINNGDGISFAGGGTNINTTKGSQIYPNKMEGIRAGLDVYRNLDRTFNPQSVRKIDVDITFGDDSVMATDQTGMCVSIKYHAEEQAINTDRAKNNIQQAFMKSGGTIFRVVQVEVLSTPFMTMSEMNELRRKLLDKLSDLRLSSYIRLERTKSITHTDLNGCGIEYTGNIANSLARRFYEKCNAGEIASAFELKPVAGVVLLRSRHCIKRELGICLKKRRELVGFQRNSDAQNEKLYIENNGRRFELRFDCAACEMLVVEIK